MPTGWAGSAALTTGGWQALAMAHRSAWQACWQPPPRSVPVSEPTAPEVTVSISNTRTAPTLDSRAGLLAELTVIDTQGWDGPAAQRLLSHVRAHIVRPQLAAAGLRGPAADQAEATGWAAAWEALTRSSFRTATTPWGLLWVAVRRAILGEVLASAYLSTARNGWRAESARREHETESSVGRGRAVDLPVSLDMLIERGWEPPAAQPGTDNNLGRRLEAVVSALVGAGWEQRAAHAVVEGVALTAVRDGKESAEAQGWRSLARRLGLPPWQVRRATVLLLGAPGWPGLIERITTEGCDILDDPSVGAALRSTAVSSWPPPPIAARERAMPPANPRALAAS